MGAGAVRAAFAETMLSLAAADHRVVLLTADLGFMVLERFAAAFPERFFNVGVAEANMIGLATGLAEQGFLPYVYSIATFASMRGYEQIRNGPVLHGLPVRIIGVGGGFEYGHAGPTHHALEDYAILRALAGLTVVAPADPAQARAALTQTAALPGPIYYRIGKNDRDSLPGLCGEFALGRLAFEREGSDVLFVSIGAVTMEVAAAADLLAQAGISCCVAVVSSLRPAPEDDLAALLARFPRVHTVEEHGVCGGLGSLVAEVIAERGLACRLTRHGVRSGLDGVSGGQAFLRARHGLRAESLAAAAQQALERGRPW